MKQEFRDKVVLVTGGSKGIGKSICLEFLKRGAKVISVYSSDDSSANAFLDELNDLRENLIFFKGSVVDKVFLKSMFDEVKKRFFKLDVLVNNAGITRDSLFLNMSKDDWQKVIDINIKGTFLTSLLALDLIKKEVGRSYIVNLSSVSGVYGNIGQVNYSTSKGAVIGMTKVFAKKYSEYNINVNCIVPGLIDTEMMNTIPQAKLIQMTDILTIKRLGRPEEIANSIMFLCSKSADYMTGSSIFVDGGFLK